ncbi:MAG: glycoside hydrolase family 3 protein, partial [Veillonella caviae]|nr:glycoside hydrolase family 3 protein [Veillonella caviae]
MVRKLVTACLVGAVVIGIAGCGLHPFATKTESISVAKVAESELSPEEKVDKMLATMSDADKVGQLM